MDSLPQPEPVIADFTFKIPSILTDVAIIDGHRQFSVREGRSIQLTHTTTTTFSFEEPQLVQEFVIRATNKIDFAGGQIDVLNNEINLQGYVLPASSPTASEYLALSGQQVILKAIDRRDQSLTVTHSKPVYRRDEVSVILP